MTNPLLNDEELDVPEGPAVEEARGISLLHSAERQRDQQAGTLFLDVPTWGGKLVAEYRVVDRPRLNALAQKIQQMRRDGNETSAMTAADIDLLLEANVGLYAFDVEAEEGKQRVPINDERGIVTYRRIGPVLGKDFRTARESVLYMMKDNAVAISAHAMKIARWMEDPSKDPSTEGLI
jgi:hypothetical protein